MAKKDGLAVVIGVGKPKPDDTGADDQVGPTEGSYEEESAETPEEETTEPETQEGAYPEFTIPEGLDLADIEPGEEKEVMCLISKTSEGQACIKQVDGVDLAGSGVGMYGPPPAEAAGGLPPPPPGMPPPGMPPGMPPGGPGGLPPELAMMAMGGAPGGPLPPSEGPGGPVKRRAAARGLM